MAGWLPVSATTYSSSPGCGQPLAGNGIARACEASLARLGTDHLDLYLLHWPNGIIDDLSRIVAGFESLRAAGKIRAWGVSNFTVSDMENLFRVPHGNRCATNQVLYNISNRGIEDDFLSWCEKRGMPVMAYAPLGERAQHMVVQRLQSRWPGRSAAVTSSQFPNPAPRRM